MPFLAAVRHPAFACARGLLVHRRACSKPRVSAQTVPPGWLQVVMDEFLDCTAPCGGGLLFWSWAADKGVEAGAWSGRVLGGPACDLPFKEGDTPFHFNNEW
jgi:hypothetical protein